MGYPNYFIRLQSQPDFNDRKNKKMKNPVFVTDGFFRESR